MAERCNCDSPMAWCGEHDPTPWTRAGYDEQGRRIKGDTCDGHPENIDLGVMGRAKRVWHADGCPVSVPSTGTYLVTDGVVRRASVDQQGYAGPQVHLIVTDEPWEDDE